MLQENARHPSDHRGCLEKSNRVVQEFFHALISNGRAVRLASEKEDLSSGIDVWVASEKLGNEVAIQVKGQHRSPDDVVPVETMRLGKPGWLYRAKSAFIAFERRDKFILVEMDKLREAANRLKNDEIVTSIGDAYNSYKVYSRMSSTKRGDPGEDRIFYLRVTDLEEVGAKSIPKVHFPGV